MKNQIRNELHNVVEKFRNFNCQKIDFWQDKQRLERIKREMSDVFYKFKKYHDDFTRYEQLQIMNIFISFGICPHCGDDRIDVFKNYCKKCNNTLRRIA